MKELNSSGAQEKGPQKETSQIREGEKKVTRIGFALGDVDDIVETVHLKRRRVLMAFLAKTVHKFLHILFVEDSSLSQESRVDYLLKNFEVLWRSCYFQLSEKSSRK